MASFMNDLCDLIFGGAIILLFFTPMVCSRLPQASLIFLKSIAVLLGGRMPSKPQPAEDPAPAQPKAATNDHNGSHRIAQFQRPVSDGSDPGDGFTPRILHGKPVRGADRVGRNACVH